MNRHGFAWVLLLLFLLPLQALAEGTTFVGLTYGLAVPDAKNTKIHQMYGLVGGAQIATNIGVGGYHMMTNSEAGPNNGKFSYSITGIEVRTYLSTGPKLVFVGLRGGVSKITSMHLEEEIIFSPYHWGLVSGFYFPFYKLLHFGFEGSYLGFQRSETTSGDEAILFPAFNAISFLAVLSIHF